MREFPKDLNHVAMYLRKSRADIEAEMRGEAETLSKHKKALLELAYKNRYNVVKIYEEIVSGERIADRPEVIKLLTEVEDGVYDAVLCMDIDRLGRGDMRDQGTIIAAFKESKTLIITPQKSYDLEDEFDEEYSEFEAFIARRELKIINKRLQRGRLASVKEGKYIGTKPPYGYDRGKDLILIPNEKEAEIVRLIFHWYVNEKIGTCRISRRLNEMKILSPAGKQWSPYSVAAILKNEVYIGRMQWRKTYRNKKKGSGYIRPREEWVDVEGKHKPLVSKEMFQQAQRNLQNKTVVPNRTGLKITNPLAGLVRCGFCGAAMVKRPYVHQAPHIRCSNVNCRNKGTRFEYVERAVLNELEKWLKEYVVNMEQVEKEVSVSTEVLPAISETVIQELEKQLSELEKQKNNLHDLLELGIYDVDTYLERNQNIMARIVDTKEALKNAKEEMARIHEQEATKENLLPCIRHIIEAYHRTDDIEKKNDLLKQIIKKVIYTKEKHQRGDNFSLEIFIFLPK
ncbi:recombinase family protein [Aneurinibacillus thermoaerophilus]|uniref:recombinase family protein n=1 Tax=Aneurinibacillus thermoaerophilus TaxID=143495 RepID=UPI002E2341FB|nr:recombinase family protein [Aneurinibacillus thermoaerophilus]MED0681013.1 recombinase family protein [Aneurinibacillus thermoaerophilus]MED0738571.1 recombinase family protein [Aneurinibacillus thermoaerophilus]MED0765701.1 recombinase family protein [Aneurinibacillus thermoaerophilus]